MRLELKDEIVCNQYSYAKSPDLNALSTNFFKYAMRHCLTTEQMTPGGAQLCYCPSVPWPNHRMRSDEFDARINVASAHLPVSKFHRDLQTLSIHLLGCC